MNSIKNSYDAWHQHRAAAEASGEAKFRPWHETVARRLPDLNGLRVLEVGCGRGDFAIWLAGKYPRAQITAVDFSDAAIQLARERARTAGADITFQVEDAENLTLASGTYDFAYSCECLEHVPHPQKMAAEIGRVLRPNGRFILTTENYCNGLVLGWLAAWWRSRKYDSGSGAQPHENFFLFWRVRKTLQAGGLKVQHMESNHFQWLLLPRVAPHRLCTEDFSNPLLKRLFRPFGRHFTFEGKRA